MGKPSFFSVARFLSFTEIGGKPWRTVEESLTEDMRWTMASTLIIMMKLEGAITEDKDKDRD